MDESDEVVRWMAEVARRFPAGLGTPSPADAPSAASYRVAPRRVVGGPWVGWYRQAFVAWGTVRMDMELDAKPAERGRTALDGLGRDGVGPFSMSGTVDPTTGMVRLEKVYEGAHHVVYEGIADARGIVRGVWAVGGYKPAGLFVLAPAEALPTRARAAARPTWPARAAVAAFAGLTVALRIPAMIQDARLVERWRWLAVSLPGRGD